jgi:hypothetical protein
MPATSLPQTLVTQVPSILLGRGQVEGGSEDVVTVAGQRRRTFGWPWSTPDAVVDHLCTRPPGLSQENEPLANPFPVSFPRSDRSLSPPATDHAVREGTGSHEAAGSMTKKAVHALVNALGGWCELDDSCVDTARRVS